MVYIDWWRLMAEGVGLLFIGLFVGLPISAILLVSDARWFIRMPVRALATLVICASISVLSFLALLANLTASTYSFPVYSPKHRHAARIETYDAGGLGGGSNVHIYTWHGLISRTVYYGGWDSVQSSGLYWISDSQLQIWYDYNAGEPHCQSMGKVSVTCVPK